MAKKKAVKKKKVSRKSIFKMNEIIIFAPSYNADWSKVGLSPGESVLFMGNVPNAEGHCAVAKRDGAIMWLFHPSDFRKALESEL